MTRQRARDPGDVAGADLALTVLLARRDHATVEARRKLQEQGYEPAVVEQVLADFTDRRLLDDARYATQFLRSRAARGQGPVRIRLELRELGLAEALIEGALASGPDFKSLCRALRERRFGPEPPLDWTEKGKQSRFLQYRGFSLDHIRSALGPDLELE